jgi:hypothetical protein
MTIFFSKEELGGSCTRMSFAEAMKQFYLLTKREAKTVWMSQSCYQDCAAWVAECDLVLANMDGLMGHNYHVEVRGDHHYLGMGDKHD